MTAVRIPRDSHFIETVLSIPRISSLGMPRTLSRPDESVRYLLFSENPTGKHFPFPLQVRNKFVHLLRERVNICPNSVGQVCPLRQGCPLKPSATPESKGPAAFAALTFLSSPTKGKPFGIPPEMRKNPGTHPGFFLFWQETTDHINIKYTWDSFAFYTWSPEQRSPRSWKDI